MAVADASRAGDYPQTVHGVLVPRSPGAMREVVDLIQATLDDGGTVCVHCRRDVRHPGTVVGCDLTRRGMTGADALARVTELWTSGEKYRRWSWSPQADKQPEYMRTSQQRTQRLTPVIGAQERLTT